MLAEALSVFQVAGETMLKLAPISIAFGIVFGLLRHWSACNPGRPWWRKREIVTDVCYDLIPLAARFVRIGFMVMGAAYFYGIHGADALISFYDDGLAPWPECHYGQALTFLLVSDFLTYWIYRGFDGVGLVEIPCRPSFIERTRLDLGRQVSSGQYFLRHGPWGRGLIARWHFAECHVVGRSGPQRLLLRSCTQI